LPHLAFPFAASDMVIPLEQEYNNKEMMIITMDKVPFFIMSGFKD